MPIISRNTHARGEGYFRLEWKLAIDRSHLIASDKDDPRFAAFCRKVGLPVPGEASARTLP
jgi:hypothetical protein